jgi:AraC family transcriptional regulator
MTPGSPPLVGEFFGRRLERLVAPGLLVVESDYQAHRTLAMHRHQLAGFRLTIDGGFLERVRAPSSQDRDCGPRALAFHPPGVQHAQRFGAKRTRVLNLEFEPARWKPWASHEGTLCSTHPLGTPTTRALAWRIHLELLRADELSAQVIDALATELLVEAIRVGRSADEGAPRWLGQALDCLRSHLAAPPSLLALSRAVDVSPDRLVRGFRRFLQATPAEWVRRERLEQSCRALERGDQTIAEVALAAGYCDQSHLTREMRRRLGQTPASYRAHFRFKSKV